MPYDTEYNRELAREIHNNNVRLLNHLEQQENTPMLQGGTGFAEEPEYVEVLGPAINKRKVVKAILGATKASKPPTLKKGQGKKKEGKGILSGIVGMLGLGASGGAEAEVKEGGSAFMTPQEKVDRIVQNGGNMVPVAEKRIIGGKKRGRKPKSNKGKEDEKLAMEVKGLKDNEMKGSGIISGIIGALGLGKEGEGAKEYKKKGGRKLLSKEEMPPSQMSGGKKANPWMTHLANFRKDHPEFKGKKLMEEAKKEYKK